MTSISYHLKVIGLRSGIHFPSLYFAVFVEPSPRERRERLAKYVSFDPDLGREVCGICKISYTPKNNFVALRILLNHIEAEHLRVISYFCPYCQRGFYNPNQKSSHIATYHREEHRMSKGKKAKQKKKRIKKEDLSLDQPIQDEQLFTLPDPSSFTIASQDQQLHNDPSSSPVKTETGGGDPEMFAQQPSSSSWPK